MNNVGIFFTAWLVAFALYTIGVIIRMWIGNKRVRDMMDFRLKLLSELVKEKEKEV